MTIFGDPPATPSATPSGVAIDAELFGADHPAPKELFPVEVQLRDTLRTRAQDVANVLGLSAPQRQAQHRDFVGIIRDTGLDPATVGGPLYHAFVDGQIAIARGRAVDDPQRQQQQDEAMRQTFRDAYPRDGNELLARTHAFIKAHPKLHAVLGTGAGADPKVMTAIAEHVRRSMWRP